MGKALSNTSVYKKDAAIRIGSRLWQRVPIADIENIKAIEKKALEALETLKTLDAREVVTFHIEGSKCTYYARFTYTIKAIIKPVFLKKELNLAKAGIDRAVFSILERTSVTVKDTDFTSAKNKLQKSIKAGLELELIRMLDASLPEKHKQPK
ncbi:MAG: hypothetical protein ABH860_04390 [bacterium]